MGIGNAALAAICLLACISIVAAEAVTASTFQEKNYYPDPTPAPSSSSPVSPSFSPPYSAPSAPTPSSSSSSTPSSPYSPPSYNPPTSPAPSGSSPISLGPALSPLPTPSTPSVPSYTPPSTGSPPCPPLASWFIPGSSGSPPSWWKDQLAAEDNRRTSLATSDPVVRTDSYDSSSSSSIPTIPLLGPSTSPTIPLVPTAAAPTSASPLIPLNPLQWATAPPNVIPIIISLVTTILDLFGGNTGSIFGSQMTLYQGLTNRRPDAYGALLRQASAAILNANSNRGYPYSANQVKASFNAALFSEQTAAVQAVRFENANRGYGVRH